MLVVGGNLSLKNKLTHFEYILIQCKYFFNKYGEIMRLHNVLKTGLAAGIFALTATAQAAVININAYYNGAPTDAPGMNTPILFSVAAGTYRIEEVDKNFAGAQYTAWNPWSYVSNCDSQGHCPNGAGWISAFAFDTGAGTAVTSLGYNSRWATPELAFANRGAGTTVTFNAPTTLRFYIPDNPHYDNQGGISVNITPVPEPETWALTLAGLGLLGVAARRKKAQA